MGCGQKAVNDNIDDLEYLVKASKTIKYAKVRLYSTEAAAALEKAYYSLKYSGPLADAYVDLQVALLVLDKQKTKLAEEFESLVNSPYMKDFKKKGP